MKTEYYCLKCGRTFILNGTLDDVKIEDGRNCPICKGPLAPVKLTLAPEPKHRVPVPPKFKPRAAEDGEKITMSRDDGLTEQEGKVSDALVTAWNEYCKLEVQHPSDASCFCEAIHTCQQILGMRILRRDYPAGWSAKESYGKCNS